MIRNTIIFITACAAIGGCATAAPTELVQARRAYDQASTGMAGNAAPAEVHVASEALALAEQSFEDEGDTYRTRDLAYVAHRKAAIAEATATISTQKAKGARADQDYQDAQGEIIRDRDEDLAHSRDALAASQRSGERTEEELAASQRSGKRTAEDLAAEKKARQAADERAAEALAALAKLAAVKAEPRGTVITLSGSVLFGSNKSAVRTSARARLEQVADVLLTDAERKIVVEGHTDSQGSSTSNLVLSRSRADAVRDLLVRRGYPADLIEARGMGEETPIADNGNAEGRANNRRVEIIVARK